MQVSSCLIEKLPNELYKIIIKDLDPNNILAFSLCSKTCYVKAGIFLSPPLPKVWEFSGLLKHRFKVGYNKGRSREKTEGVVFWGIFLIGFYLGFLFGVHLLHINRQKQKMYCGFDLNHRVTHVMKVDDCDELKRIILLIDLIIPGYWGLVSSFYGLLFGGTYLFLFPDFSRKVNGIVVGSYFSLEAAKSWGKDIAKPNYCLNLA